MELIVCIDQSDERAGIDNDHALFLRRFRSAFKERPVAVERFGSAPCTTPIKSVVVS
jgi:hypothetical protein